MDDIRREIEQLTVTKKNPNKNSAGKAGSPGKIIVENLSYLTVPFRYSRRQ